MSIFTTTKPADQPQMAAAEYAALADRMLSLRGDISNVLRELQTQSERLEHLEDKADGQPVALLLEVEKQVDHLASIFFSAAKKRGRDEILAAAGQRAWQIILGSAAAYLLLKWNTVLGFWK